MFGVEGLGFRVIGVPLAVVDVRSCFFCVRLVVFEIGFGTSLQQDCDPYTL